MSMIVDGIEKWKWTNLRGSVIGAMVEQWRNQSFILMAGLGFMVRKGQS